MFLLLLQIALKLNEDCISLKPLQILNISETCVISKSNSDRFYIYDYPDLKIYNIKKNKLTLFKTFGKKLINFKVLNPQIIYLDNKLDVYQMDLNNNQPQLIINGKSLQSVTLEENSILIRENNQLSEIFYTNLSKFKKITFKNDYYIDGVFKTKYLFSHKENCQFIYNNQVYLIKNVKAKSNKFQGLMQIKGVDDPVKVIDKESQNKTFPKTEKIIKELQSNNRSIFLRITDSKGEHIAYVNYELKIYQLIIKNRQKIDKMFVSDNYLLVRLNNKLEIFEINYL